VWHTQCVIFDWRLKQMCNRKNVPNQNFKWSRLFSVVSVSSISAFWCSENAISGHRSFCLTKQYRIQFRCLGDTYRVVMCCMNSGKLSILPWWFERWYNRTQCLIKILKESWDSIFVLNVPLRSFAAFWRPEKHISGHCLFCLTKQYWKEFQCL